MGGCLIPTAGRFTPENDPVPIVKEAGWARGLIWTDAGKSLLLQDSILGPSIP
jgi:hypothetical protein